MGMMSPAQASVAQLDRVLPSEGRGRGFESRLVHQICNLDLSRTVHESLQEARPARAFLFLADPSQRLWHAAAKAKSSPLINTI